MIIAELESNCMPEMREVAPDDRRLVGAAVRAYQQRYNLTEAEVAARLGVAPERLGWLLLRTRPAPASPSFEAEVRRLADTFECDGEALFDVLRAL